MPPLDEPTLLRLGAAVVQTCGKKKGNVRVLIGQDTRESGAWIVRHLARGIEGESGRVVDGGILPTPAVAFLTKQGGFDAGLVVSASHNPFQDNGVKVFTHEGMKADDDLEACLTETVSDQEFVCSEAPLSTREASQSIDAYIDHTKRVFDGVSLPSNLRLAIDCANGATSRIAPAVFGELGLDPVVICNEPNGRNINLRCGSTNPDRLARTVLDLSLIHI